MQFLPRKEMILTPKVTVRLDGVNGHRAVIHVAQEPCDHGRAPSRLIQEMEAEHVRSGKRKQKHAPTSPRVGLRSTVILDHFLTKMSDVVSSVIIDAEHVLERGQSLAVRVIQTANTHTYSQVNVIASVQLDISHQRRVWQIHPASIRVCFVNTAMRNVDQVAATGQGRLTVEVVAMSVLLMVDV
mmetsp:Transcript_12349/g.37084  ORF Transcript_12349/g.37084 Transcript_12349/m.37084 type:complete len:185 (+) Transcript_12349:71-625(+)